MLYAIIAEDGKDSMPKRLANRPAHLERLHALKAEGSTAGMGPAGFTGSIIIAEFPSLAEAEAWANDDPYLIGGVYIKVTVKPFKKVLP